MLFSSVLLDDTEPVLNIRHPTGFGLESRVFRFHQPLPAVPTSDDHDGVNVAGSDPTLLLENDGCRTSDEMLGTGKTLCSTLDKVSVLE